MKTLKSFIIKVFRVDRFNRPDSIKRESIPKNLKNEKGMILLTVLILMVIITLLGTIAINSSTIEVQISGNEKRIATAFAGAEAGLGVSVPVIESTLDVGYLKPAPGSFTLSGVTMDETNLANEILDPAHSYDPDTTSTPDISIPSLGGVKVNVDIDRLFSEAIAGGALEFAMGYEGVGAGAAGGGVAVYYRISSSGKK